MEQTRGLKVTLIAAVVACATCSLTATAVGSDKAKAESDRSAVVTFFKDFQVAYNAGKADRVKAMSGTLWSHWSSDLGGKEKFADIEVLDVATGDRTLVTVKITTVSGNRKNPPVEVVFTLKAIDGGYVMEKMAVPTVEKRNDEVQSSFAALGNLVKAINSQDFESIRKVISIGAAEDVRLALSGRDLQWIADAVDKKIEISESDIAVTRNRDAVIGKVIVPDALGGSNVVHKLVFRNGKVDCAAHEGKRAVEDQKNSGESKRQSRMKRR